ncbi:MAG: cyclic nucleotide-binding domain-containing protein, partial [Anaerolineales bacterium]|nr:cyclic nucleotide-binding domain-containing protein [Anaerolineales bacterium]
HPMRVALQQAAQQASDSSQSIWNWLAEKLDLAQTRPQAAAGILSSRLTGRGEVYFILKNPHTHTYFRLSDKDYFLWERMDGSRTVKDLVVAYFMEYKALGFGRVTGLIEGLKKRSFLSEPPVDVYSQVRTQLERRTPQGQLSKLWGGFVEKQFAIQGIDSWLGNLYNRLGWLFFTRPAQILLLLVSLAGLACFFRTMLSGTYSLINVGSSTLSGVVSLFFVYLFSVFIHEMGHALTVKHFRREVPRGGFMVFYGFPAFFVDTSDIWMEGKRARLAVTWAGPYTDLIQAGLASLALFGFPSTPMAPFLYQFALVTYLSVLANLNPLLELDGYFLLMDGLEIPMLRRRSLDFIRGGVWTKLKTLLSAGKKASQWAGEFSREERIFVVFGLLASLWTAFSVIQALIFWQTNISDAAISLFRNSRGVGRIALLAVGGTLGLGLVIYIGYSLPGLIRQVLARNARFFATPWRKATWAWGLVLILGGLSAFYPPSAHLAPLGVLSLWIYFSARNTRAYSGSYLAPFFTLVGAAGFLFGLAEVSLFAPGLSPAWASVLTNFAALVLAAAGLALIRKASFKRLLTGEKIILLTGTAACIAWAVAAFVLEELPCCQSLLPGLVALFTLTVLVPTLVDYWPTRTGPAMLTLLLGLAVLLCAGLFILPPIWAYLFMTASLGLHQAAFRERAVRFKIPDHAGLDLPDHELLEQAFRWLINGLYAQIQEISGKRQAQILQDQFNQYAQASRWQIRVNNDQVEDNTPPECSIYQRGEIYAAALTLLLDMMAVSMGNALTTCALQNVYDSLTWGVREIAAQYLFPHMKRATVLSQQFQAAKYTYQALVRRIPLFASLSHVEIDQLCQRLKVERFAPQQVIIRQGEQGDKFYIVTSGHVEVEQRNAQGVSEIVNHKDRGAYFGEVALLNDAPRSATCRAVVPTEVVSLKRADFDQLVRVCFDLRDKLESSIARTNLLRQIPIFSDMDEQHLHLVWAQMQAESYPAGTVIIRQGELGEVFYVIESGQVEMTIMIPDGEQNVDQRGPGEYFGEIALLLQTPRTATVRAVTPVCLLALHKNDFDQLVVPQLYASRLSEQEVSRRMLRMRRVAKS